MKDDEDPYADEGLKSDGRDLAVPARGTARRRAAIIVHLQNPKAYLICPRAASTGVLTGGARRRELGVLLSTKALGQLFCRLSARAVLHE